MTITDAGTPSSAGVAGYADVSYPGTDGSETDVYDVGAFTSGEPLAR